MPTGERRLGLLPPGPRAQEVPPLSAALKAMAPLPQPSRHMSWTAAVSGPFEVLGNNDYGNCAVVAAAQLSRIATAVCGVERKPLLSGVMSEYEAFGFDPARPEQTDLGVRLTDLLERWKNVGLRLANGAPDKLLGYLAIDWRNPEEMRWAISWFCGLIFGQNIPHGAVSDNPYWNLKMDAAALEPAGGHATACASYGPEGYTQITWGGFRVETPDFMQKFCFECYAPIMADWTMPSGLIPSGITCDEAEARIRALAAASR